MADTIHFDNGGSSTFHITGGSEFITAVNDDDKNWSTYTSTSSFKYAGVDGLLYVKYSDYDWIDVSNVAVTDGILSFDATIGLNTEGYMHVAYIWVKGIDASGTIHEIQYRITQVATYRKLWATLATSLTVANSRFDIFNSRGKKVFEGYSYSPRSGGIFDLSSIAQSLITRPSFPYTPTENLGENLDLVDIYTVKRAGTETIITTAPYIYNWDYGNGDLSNIFIGSPCILNSPVNNSITPLTYPSVTAYGCSPRWTALLVRGNKVIETQTITAYETSPVMRFTPKFETALQPGDSIGMYDTTDDRRIINFNVVCGDWELHYLNRNGAYDVYPIEGNVKIYDTYNKTSYTREVSTITRQFSTVDISNRTETEYEFVTGWLTDEQSEVVANQLLPSLAVFVQHGEEIIPINITNSKVEHKIFRNGHNLNQYTITAASSQYRINR